MLEPVKGYVYADTRLDLPVSDDKLWICTRCGALVLAPDASQHDRDHHPGADTRQTR